MRIRFGSCSPCLRLFSRQAQLFWGGTRWECQVPFPRGLLFNPRPEAPTQIGVPCPAGSPRPPSVHLTPFIVQGSDKVSTLASKPNEMI